MAIAQPDLTIQPFISTSNKYLMVLGSPGIGKSTFLRKVGLEALKGKNGGFTHKCIPVFLTLRLSDKDKSIETHIAEEFANCGFDHATELSQAALEKSKLLVLLDGLDEVPIDRLDQTITQRRLHKSEIWSIATTVTSSAIFWAVRSLRCGCIDRLPRFGKAGRKISTSVGA